MNKLNTFLFLYIATFLYSCPVNGQHIISPDTVCVNEQVYFTVDTTYVNHITYAWEFGTPTMTPILSTAIPVPGTGIVGSGSTGMFSTIGSVAMAYDNGNYYAFVTSALNYSVQRLDFGNNPNGTPTITNLGNPGNAIASSPSSAHTETIEIIKEKNLWYGFIIDRDAVVRLEFGNSLTNTPTGTRMSFPGIMEYGMQLTMLKYNNEWIGFCGNTGNSWWGSSTLNTQYIHRFDFGTSLTNIPAVTILPNYNMLSECYYFALHYENGNWYMLVTNYSGTHGNTIARYDFGANLKNNNPTLVNVGNPGLIQSPRAITTVKSCDTFFAVQLNENGTANAIDFRSNITGTATTQSLGQVYGSVGMATQMYKPYWFRDTLWLITGNFSGLSTANIYRFPVLRIPSGTAVINYYDPAITYTFTTPGVYDVTLYCDQGDQKGPLTFCKQIVVQPDRKNLLGPDTTICNGAYTLDATLPGATGYLWSTGATTPSIAVTSAGRYSVAVTGSMCHAADTIQVAVGTTPTVDLGPDTTICDGAFTLHAAGGPYTNPVYTWSTGVSTPTISVIQTGRYYLNITSGGCTGSDTVDINILPKPVVDLGEDLGICRSAAPLILQSSQPTGTQYLWSTGLSGTQIQVMYSGTYWLQVSRNGCYDRDTIHVEVINDPIVNIGPDSIICEQVPLRIGTEIPYATYSWGTGEKTPYIDVTTTDNYVLSVNLAGCIVNDTVHITATQPPTIDLGPNTDICEQQTIVLDASYDDGNTYLWNTGATTTKYVATQAGLYYVHVTSAYKCVSTDSILLKYFPKPTIILPDDTTVCEETPLILKPVYSINEDDIQWSTGSTERQLSITQGGTYIVQATNKCGSNADTINVRQIFCDIWLPNAFTPNGDGTNDILKVLGNIGRLQDFVLSIYNRWGEEVFTTNSKTGGWDGTYKGTPASLDTYVYMLQYSIDGKPVSQKGNVTLLR